MADLYSVLIVGASRGIGLEFVKQFLTNPLVKTNVVIAACRSPHQANDLQELKKSHSNLNIIKLNVTEFDTYEKVVKEVESIVGEPGLTLLINNAGVGAGSDTLDDVTVDELLSKLTTNTIAPIMLTKAFRPLIKKSAQAKSATTEGLSVTKAAVINICSFLGSIKLNQKKGHWCYRESKAALNMATKSLARDLVEDDILVEGIHPGHVRTDMGGPQGAIDTTTSVTGILKVLLQLKEKNQDGYYNFKGDVLPF